jgi:hypothetical protein
MFIPYLQLHKMKAQEGHICPSAINIIRSTIQWISIAFGIMTLVIAVWSVLRLQLEETTSMFGANLRILNSNRRQPTGGSLNVWS